MLVILMASKPVEADHTEQSGITDVFTASSKDPLGIVLEHSIASSLQMKL